MLSMREAMLVVPKADNRGVLMQWVRDEAVSQCVKHFGGATILSAEGAWDNGTQFYQEPVWLILTAMEPTADNVSQLFDIADMVMREMQQEAVYVRLPDGTVAIRDKVSKLAEALAA